MPAAWTDVTSRSTPLPSAVELHLAVRVLVARVVDDERDAGMVGGRRADVDGRGERRAAGEALVDGDDVDTELLDVAQERARRPAAPSGS